MQRVPAVRPDRSEEPPHLRGLACRIDRSERSRFTVVGVIFQIPRGDRPLKLQYLGAWDGKGGRDGRPE